MKRFLIHVSTYWCGMDNTFRAEAESELELYEIAEQLAYDNFQSYGCEADIAEEEGYDPDTGEIIDYFGGMEDLKSKILRTPLDTYVTLDDDPLRILRGIRFSITKNFGFSNSLFDAISNYDYESKMSVVSEERIREELVKCFKHDTSRTLFALCIVYKSLGDYIFTHTNLWLKPTNEK